MSDIPHAPAPRRRGRKLRLALAIVGILLAAFVVLLVDSSGPESSRIPVVFQRYQTNTPDHVVAWFSVTNSGSKTILWMIVDSQTRWGAERQWTGYSQNFNPVPFLRPGGVTNFSIRVPHDGTSWRVQVEWLEELSTVRKWRAWIHLKLGDTAGALRARNARLYLSDEFQR